MNERPTAAGFTLIETVVAMAILGLGLAALFPVFGAVLDRNFKADSQAMAASLAQSLTARLGADLPLAPGMSSGSFGNGYRWEMEISPYGEAGDRDAWPLAPYQVLATVRWQAGGRERSMTLTTLRLASKDTAL
ncbi:MAG: type II secretion system protein [Aliidongia sp.]